MKRKLVTPLEFVEILRNYEALAAELGYELDYTHSEAAPSHAGVVPLSAEGLRAALSDRIKHMHPGSSLGLADILTLARWDSSDAPKSGHKNHRGVVRAATLAATSAGFIQRGTRYHVPDKKVF